MLRSQTGAAVAPALPEQMSDRKQLQQPLAATPLANPVRKNFPEVNQEGIPPEVKVQHLNKDGRLITEVQYDRVLAILKDKPPGRYSKKLFAEIGVPYGIIKDEYGDIYPIYRYTDCKLTPDQQAQVEKVLENVKPGFYPLHFFSFHRISIPYSIIKNENGTIEVSSQVVIGQGAYGGIKITQNHRTKEWWALKTGNFVGQNGACINVQARHDIFQAELNMLRALNRTDQVLLFERNSKKTGVKKVDFLMRYESGVSFKWILDNRSRFSDIKILDITVDFFDEYMDKIFGKKVLHRDIKPSNMVYDLTRNLPRIIDLGFAVRHDDSYTYEDKHKRGTPGYIAPELKDYTVYSDETEVYAWGRVLSQALLNREMVVITRVPLELIVKDSPAPETSFRQKRNIVKFIDAMCSDDPDDRPKLQEVLHFLHKLKFIAKLRFIKQLHLSSQSRANQNDPVVIVLDNLVKQLDGRISFFSLEPSISFDEKDFTACYGDYFLRNMLIKGKDFLPDNFRIGFLRYIEVRKELKNKLESLSSALSDPMDAIVIAINKLLDVLDRADVEFTDKDFKIYLKDPVIVGILKKNIPLFPKHFCAKYELHMLLSECNNPSQFVYRSSPICMDRDPEIRVIRKLIQLLNHQHRPDEVQTYLNPSDQRIIDANHKLKNFMKRYKDIFAGCYDDIGNKIARSASKR